ncbi:MAG: hypothetical protein ACNA7Q_07650 [Rhodobacterales bacterium]
MTQSDEQRLVLHVGPHKTATTYMQTNFARLRPRLAQAGWIYPDAVGIQSGIPEAHHDLAYRAETYFWPNRDNHHQLTRLANLLQQNGKNLLLSAEGFSMWSLPQYLRLADILGFHRIEVAYALRDPVALLHSYWAEEVKQGMTASFPDRIAGATLDPLGSRLLNPLLDLNPLIASDRITLRLIPFEVLKANDIDLFSHFCSEILNIDALKPRIKTHVNAGFPIEQTEFLRMMTLMRCDGQSNVGPAFRMAFIQNTTPAERRHWNAQIRTAAADARQHLDIPADAFFRLAIEGRVTTRAGRYCTLAPQGGALFNRQDKTLAFYDDYRFWHNPVVKALALHVIDRLTATPIRPARPKTSANRPGHQPDPAPNTKATVNPSSGSPKEAEHAAE